MQTLTSRRTTVRRWARCLGAGHGHCRGRRGRRRAGVRRRQRTRRAAPAGAWPLSAARAWRCRTPARGQTTVNWTGTTTFSKTVTESVGSFAVGDCVTVTGTASKKSKTTIAARSHHRDHAELERHRAPAVPSAGGRRPPARSRSGFRGAAPAAEGSPSGRGWSERHPAVLPVGVWREQLPQGLGEPRHRLGQGDRGQRVRPLTVSGIVALGRLLRAPSGQFEAPARPRSRPRPRPRR